MSLICLKKVLARLVLFVFLDASPSGQPIFDHPNGLSLAIASPPVFLSSQPLQNEDHLVLTNMRLVAGSGNIQTRKWGHCLQTFLWEYHSPLRMLLLTKPSLFLSSTGLFLILVDFFSASHALISWRELCQSEFLARGHARVFLA